MPETEHTGRTYTIRWTDIGANSYLYGATILAEEDGHVTYRCMLAPPGTVLHSWHTHRVHVRDRTEPSFPLLMPGRSYRFRAHLEVTPEESALFCLLFYDYNGSVLQRLTSDRMRFRFRCPEETYGIELRLMSGGAHTIRFSHITITRGDE